MEHKKDIGKAIREKLDALDKAPGDHLWAAIEADLPKKKKRRLLPFWITFASLTVIALLLWSLLDGPENYRPERHNDNLIEKRGRDLHNGNFPNGESIGQPSDQTTAGGQSIEGSNGRNAAANEANGNNAVDGTVENKARGKMQLRNGSGPIASGTAETSDKSKSDKFSSNIKNKKKLKRGKGGTGNSSLAANDSDAKDGKANSKAADVTAGGLGNDPRVSANGSASETTQNASEITARATNDSIAKALAEEKKKPAEKPKDSLPKQDLEQQAFKTFRIFLYGAPTYYNTFSDISSIDRRLDSLPRKAEITFNYGGYLCFDYDERLSFRFGIAKTNLRHRTEGIAVSSLSSTNYYNIEYGQTSNTELQQRFADSERFDLVQEISYLEFPIEIKYKLLDNTIGIEGIGGISTSFLKGNSITAESDRNGSVVLGSTKDQYKAYISLNIGAGFYWRFANNFRLNVEPIFKYHFRTASTALQPYSVAVLGGVEYTFNWRVKKKADKK